MISIKGTLMAMFVVDGGVRFIDYRHHEQGSYIIQATTMTRVQWQRRVGMGRRVGGRHDMNLRSMLRV
jgi:hypothetical protein